MSGGIQKKMIFSALVFILCSYFCISYSSNYVYHRADHGSYWIEHTTHVDILFNSSHETYEILSMATWITTGPLNITGGNATILLFDSSDGVIVNLTNVIGVFNPGINTTELLEYPPLNYRFVIHASTEGVRVNFDYIEHGLLYWDGVPKTEYDFEYYVLMALGIAFLCLSILSMSFPIVKYLRAIDQLSI